MARWCSTPRTSSPTWTPTASARSSASWPGASATRAWSSSSPARGPRTTSALQTADEHGAPGRVAARRRAGRSHRPAAVRRGRAHRRHHAVHRGRRPRGPVPAGPDHPLRREAGGMIWVYAICEREVQRLPGVGGLGGAPLEAICEGPLLAVASRGDRVPDALSVELLCAHERVVEALLEERAVLPMRFGTTFAAPGEVQAALAARSIALLDALDRVRGRVELAVRARRPAAEAAEVLAPAGAGGREYLAARLRSSRLATTLHEPLAALATATRC